LHPVGSYCTDISRCTANKTFKYLVSLPYMLIKHVPYEYILKHCVSVKLKKNPYFYAAVI